MVNQGEQLLHILNVSFVLPALYSSFKRSRDQRQGSEFLSRKLDFVRWSFVAFLSSGVFIITRAGIELITPVFNHCNTTPLRIACLSLNL